MNLLLENPKIGICKAISSFNNIGGTPLQEAKKKKMTIFKLEFKKKDIADLFVASIWIMFSTVDK